MVSLYGRETTQEPKESTVVVHTRNEGRSSAGTSDLSLHLLFRGNNKGECNNDNIKGTDKVQISYLRL